MGRRPRKEVGRGVLRTGCGVVELLVVDGSGRKLASGPVETSKTELERTLARYTKRGLKVAVEAGNQTAWIHDCLVGMGAEVVVVNPAKKLIAEGRRKTDKVDAKVLAELLRLDGLPYRLDPPDEGGDRRARAVGRTCGATPDDPRCGEDRGDDLPGRSGRTEASLVRGPRGQRRMGVWSAFASPKAVRRP